MNHLPSSAPDLPALRVFVAVACQRSYRQAALALGLTPSAVSQAVRRLEQQLGLTLFARSTRSVALTEAGARLLQDLTPALQGLDAALAGAAELREGLQALRGRLRLSVPRSAARLLLAPLVARLCARHPQLEVELCAQDALVDIVEQGFDAGVRFEERLPGDMVALPLAPPQTFVVVTHPALLADRAAPQHPNELAGWPAIRQRMPSGALLRWEFARGPERLLVEPQGRLTLDDQAAVLAHALEGAGLAYVYECAARPLLDQGRLVELLPAWRAPGTGLWLYYPSRRQASPGLRALIELLREGDTGLSRP